MMIGGRYLKDIIYGASDGIITTFAVIAGVTGAGLSVSTALILGVVSIFADGFSMASSDYLATKSEREYLAKAKNMDSFSQDPKNAAIITFISFAGAGALPILPYIFAVWLGLQNVFWISVASTAFALFLVGSLRTYFTGKGWFKSGLEMLVVGGLAAFIAFMAGSIVSAIIGG